MLCSMPEPEGTPEPLAQEVTPMAFPGTVAERKRIILITSSSDTDACCHPPSPACGARPR